MISVSFCHVFYSESLRKCPGGGVLARFYRPGGWGFELSFCPGVGNSPIQEFLGVLPGGGAMVRLGID